MNHRLEELIVNWDAIKLRKNGAWYKICQLHPWVSNVNYPILKTIKGTRFHDDVEKIVNELTPQPSPP